jgi:hypothetical protein
MMRRLTGLLLGLATLGIADPTVAQSRPPSITELSRCGLARGATVTIIVVGTNLEGAKAVLFDDPRLSARIVRYEDKGEDKPRRSATDTGAPIRDLARKGELTIEVTAAASLPPGDYALRIRTPLGTTATRPIEVGELAEAIEAEPNDDTPEPVNVPLTVNGEAGWPGDTDKFAFDAAAGQQLVLSVEAAGIGSRLDASLALRDAAGTILARNDDENENARDALLIHTVASAGTYVLELSDAGGGGGTNSAYRLSMGELPYVSSLFPLGGLRETATRFSARGANLRGNTISQALTLPAPTRAARIGPPPVQSDITPLPVAVGSRTSLSTPVVARGIYPEVRERETLSRRASGQPILVPSTINGRIAPRTTGAPRASSADTFRFTARKGQRIVLSVMAARLGSPLDATLEVLDARGRPVPRAMVRPVWETSVDLRSRGSMDPGLRLLSWAELRRGDYIFADRELMRVRELPKGPDEDVQLTNFRGRRFSYEGTSGEGHALTRPVYKVEVHPPGTTFSPNGLPLFELHYRNDDGGPVFGKDPYLDFTAPTSGEYLVRISDSRGEASDLHAYRLTVAPPRPDFTLSVSPANPNVPRGGRIPVTIVAFRHDGFDGPIHVELRGLGPGLTATKGVILPGHYQTAVTIEAVADAESDARPFTVHGRARIGGKIVSRTVDLTRAIAVASVTEPAPVRIVSVEPAAITLEPGQSAKVTVTIARQNGFGGRVPVNVLNLPFFLTIPDIGLNGILITEQQESRDFTILADPQVEPLEQTLFVTARGEVNSGEPVDQASTPITIKVTAGAVRRGAPKPTETSSSARR